MSNKYNTEKHFCAFPSFYYYEINGIPVSDAKAEYGMHPDAVLHKTEQFEELFNKLNHRLTDEIKDKTSCLSCNHSGENHLHTGRYNDGYEECKIEGCKCKWFSPDSEI